MRCRRAREHLTLYLLGELDPAAKAQVDEHLASCAACAEELEALRGLVDTVEGALASVPTAAGLGERILNQVAVTPLPRRVRRGDVPAVPVAEDEVERDMRRRSSAQLILAAAVVLLIVVLWQTVPRREETPPADRPGEQAAAGSRPTSVGDLAAAGTPQVVKVLAYARGSTFRVFLDFTGGPESRPAAPAVMAEARGPEKREAIGPREPVAETPAAPTVPGEDFKAAIGEDPDLTGEMKILSDRKLGPRSRSRKVHIELRNRKKDTDVEIEVVQRLGPKWEIQAASHPWRKKDAQTAACLVPVKRQGAAVITYTVRTWW